MTQPTAVGNAGAALARPLDLSPSELLGRILRRLHDSEFADHTVQRMAEIMARFTTYLEKGHRISSVREIAEEHVEAFVFAASLSRKGRRRPAVATMHLRRTALRLYFRTAHEAGVMIEDSTSGLVLPQRSGLALRALTDDEVALCRSCSLATPLATLRPAAWALAEASARTSEIPHVQVRDVDLGAGRVWMHGSAKAEARWGYLTAWGAKQVARRMEALAGRGDAVLAWQNGQRTAQAGTISKAIEDTLVRAGFGSERDVRPLSVVGWVGAGVLAETGRIDAAARRMGMRSLDRAARLIGWNWNNGHEGGAKDLVL